MVAVVAVASGVAALSGGAPSGPPAVVHAAGLPSGVSELDGGLPLSGTPRAGAPVVDLYEDFQCPFCGRFEQAFGPQLQAASSRGEVRVVVHLLVFLDRRLGNNASTRAALAALCAADAGRFTQYYATVFANQPVDEGGGWTDDELAGFATAAGITGAALTGWRACATSPRYSAYLGRVERQAAAAGVVGTPTVFVDGRQVDLSRVRTPDLGALLGAGASA